MINLIIFLFFLAPPSDFDFGWHLKYGEYFWNHGQILWQNTFSSTFPQFQWINHSWLYDLIIYPVFHLAGWLGIAFLGPAVIFIALKIIFKMLNASPVQQVFGAAILSFLGLYSFGLGLRSRYPSFIFLALLYWIIDRGRKKFYFFYLLPPMFILWANLHGTYTMGLLFLALTWLVEPNKNIRYWLAFGTVVAVTVLATVVNPFGFKIFGEALDLTNSSYRRLVLEYAPLLSLNNALGPMMILYSVLIPIGLFINRKKEYFLEALVLIPFLYLSFDAIRNMAVYLFLSIPLIIKLYRPVNIKIPPLVFPLFTLAIATGLVMRLYPLWNYSWNDYCRFSTNCSVKAVEYLKANPPKGRGFNFYDWGGFMIWQVPQVKPFIDGRMHLWHEGDNYIMNTYMQTLQGQGDVEKVFKDFDFTWAMVPPKWPIVEKLDQMVKDNKWQRVFWDNNAIIYVRL